MVSAQEARFQLYGGGEATVEYCTQMSWLGRKRRAEHAFLVTPHTTAPLVLAVWRCNGAFALFVVLQASWLGPIICILHPPQGNMILIEQVFLCKLFS